MHLSPKLAAAISAVLFASTLGVLIAVAAFGILRIAEQMGEAVSLVPARWGETNPDLLVSASAIMALPVVVWFVVWFFKKALAAEISLENYRYTAPEAPKQTGKK